MILGQEGIQIKNVCMGCKERHVGCHQDCRTYNDAKNAYNERKEAVKAKKAIDKTLDAYEFERVASAIKKRKNKKI